MKEIFKNMNILSKTAIKYGTVLIATLYLLALYFFIQSKIAADTFYSVQMYTDLLESAKECMGAVYVMPLMIEIVQIASGRKVKEEKK